MCSAAPLSPCSPRLTSGLLPLTVGSIIGFSLVYAGSAGVLWYVPDPASFPPYKGFVPIVVSWFFSPIFCAIASSSIFLSLKFTILRRQWGYKASIWLLPLFVFVVFLCCIYFVFTKVCLSMETSLTSLPPCPTPPWDTRSLIRPPSHSFHIFPPPLPCTPDPFTPPAPHSFYPYIAGRQEVFHLG